ncbi:hypothetical protein ACFL2B_02320 [Patescibacteria group bacterium]
MKKIKILLVCLVLGLVLGFGGCDWFEKPAGTSLDQAEESETAGEPEAVAQAGLSLADESQLEVSSEELIAGSYDGPVVWSPDGRYAAIHMSNMTMGSTQVQIIDVETGERQAIVAGYDLHWNEDDPSKIVFTQHQYLNAPDFGSNEVILQVDQEELFANEIFNEEQVTTEEIGTSEMGDNLTLAGCLEALQGEGIICARYTEDGEYIVLTQLSDGQPSLFIMPRDGDVENAVLLVPEGTIVDYFDLHDDRIIYKKLTGEYDELENLLASDESTEFIIATLKK